MKKKSKTTINTCTIDSCSFPLPYLCYNFEFYKSMRSPISIQSRHFELRSSIQLVPLHTILSLKFNVYSSRRDQTTTLIIVKVQGPIFDKELMINYKTIPLIQI